MPPLIVIIIGDKVLHRIIREKLFHLRIKLRRQCLIVGDHQRRLIELLDHIRHRKRLTGSGHSKQRLKLIPLFKSLHQLARLPAADLRWAGILILIQNDPYDFS